MVDEVETSAFIAVAGLWLAAGPARDAAVLRRLGREPTWVNRLVAPGRHSLGIYLVHQPLLLPVVAACLTLAGGELHAGVVG